MIHDVDATDLVVSSHPGTPDPAPGAVDLWDRTDERSVINLVHSGVQAHLIEATKTHPHLFQMNERELHRHLQKEHREPSPTENRLRLAFWMEYDRAQAEGKNMRMESIYTGICVKQFFYGRFLTDPHRIAWLLTPPVSYVVKMAEALDYGLDRMRDILEMDPRSDGKLNVKLMELQAKLVLMMDQRVKGAVTQKIEQRSIGLNINANPSSVAGLALDNTMEELEKRLKVLERMEKKALNMPEKAPMIEVTNE